MFIKELQEFSGGVLTQKYLKEDNKNFFVAEPIQQEVNETVFRDFKHIRCLLALTTRVRLHRTTSAAFVHVCSRCKHLIC